MNKQGLAGGFKQKFCGLSRKLSDANMTLTLTLTLTLALTLTLTHMAPGQT